MTKPARAFATAADRARDVIAILRRYRMPVSTEALLQAAIAEVLTREAVTFQRETVLSARDRPDFLLPPGLAIEVKIKGPVSAVLRQLERYAEHDRVGAVLLVTTRPDHIVPAEINGKPILCVCIGSAFL